MGVLFAWTAWSWVRGFVAFLDLPRHWTLHGPTLPEWTLTCVSRPVHRFLRGNARFSRFTWSVSLVHAAALVLKCMVTFGAPSCLWVGHSGDGRVRWCYELHDIVQDNVLGQQQSITYADYASLLSPIKASACRSMEAIEWGWAVSFGLAFFISFVTSALLLPHQCYFDGERRDRCHAPSNAGIYHMLHLNWTLTTICALLGLTTQLFIHVLQPPTRSRGTPQGDVQIGQRLIYAIVAAGLDFTALLMMEIHVQPDPQN